LKNKKVRFQAFRKYVLKMVYIKSFAQQHMAITGLFTLQERPGLLQYESYVENTPGETGG